MAGEKLVKICIRGDGVGMVIKLHDGIRRRVFLSLNRVRFSCAGERVDEIRGSRIRGLYTAPVYVN